MTRVCSIHNDLVEAFVGFYEDEIDGKVFQSDEARRSWAEVKIRESTPKERLEVYLHWNGIIGYAGRIWEISQGSFES